jgi:hypothetical protein
MSYEKEPPRSMVEVFPLNEKSLRLMNDLKAGQLTEGLRREDQSDGKRSSGRKAPSYSGSRSIVASEVSSQVEDMATGLEAAINDSTVKILSQVSSQTGKAAETMENMIGKLIEAIAVQTSEIRMLREDVASLRALVIGKGTIVASTGTTVAAPRDISNSVSQVQSPKPDQSSSSVLKSGLIARRG